MSGKQCERHDYRHWNINDERKDCAFDMNASAEWMNVMTFQFFALSISISISLLLYNWQYYKRVSILYKNNDNRQLKTEWRSIDWFFYEKKTNSWFSNKCECFVNSRLSKMNESMPNETETLRLFLVASKMKISGEYRYNVYGRSMLLFNFFALLVIDNFTHKYRRRFYLLIIFHLCFIWNF